MTLSHILAVSLEVFSAVLIALMAVSATLHYFRKPLTPAVGRRLRNPPKYMEYGYFWNNNTYEQGSPVRIYGLCVGVSSSLASNDDHILRAYAVIPCDDAGNFLQSKPETFDCAERAE